MKIIIVSFLKLSLGMLHYEEGRVISGLDKEWVLKEVLTNL
jgi:hypothetical protein